MDAGDKTWELLSNLLQQLPSMLTLVGCFLFAISKWKRHLKVSLVLSGSLLFLFLHTMVIAITYAWVPDLVISRGRFQRYDSIQTLYTVMSLIYNTGLAIGFALLLTSIFMERKGQVSETHLRS